MQCYYDASHDVCYERYLAAYRLVWRQTDRTEQSSVGDMMAFIQYAMHVIMSFLFISMMFIMVPRASVSADRISEILTTENKVADPEKGTEKHLGKKVKGVVEFKERFLPL